MWAVDAGLAARMAAANEGATALTDAVPWPVSVTFTTWIASLLAGMWRVCLTPLDTCKTVLQVEGHNGFALLMKKVRSYVDFDGHTRALMICDITSEYRTSTQAEVNEYDAQNTHYYHDEGSGISMSTHTRQASDTNV